MYKTFFNLSELPFSNTPDPRFFFVSRHHDEALSFLTYGIDEKKGFIVVTGEVGTGKTTLCRLLLDRLDRRASRGQARVRTSLILNSFLSTIELLQAINADFGLAALSTSRKALIDELNKFLLAEASEGGNAVVIIDEAQNLSPETLEQIRMLSNLETEKEKLVQIVLVGQPEFRETLGRTDLRQLSQRISLRYHMTGLSAAETSGYLRHRLQTAGARDGPFFTTRAEEKIHEFSRGTPRLINRIADQALSLAGQRESGTVTHEMVEAAVLELDWKAESLPQGMKGKGGTILGRLAHPAVLGGTFLGLGLAAAAAIQIGWRPYSAPPVVPEPAREAGRPASQPAAWMPDAKGHFHARTSEEASAAVILTLLRLWGVEMINVDFLPRMSEKDAKLTEVGKMFGFFVSKVDVDSRRLLRLNRPFAVVGTWSGERRPALVVWANEKEAGLFDPVSGMTSASWGDLARKADGKAVVWWKGPAGLTVPFAVKRGSALMKFQEILAAAGDYKAVPDGRLGPRTREAIHRAEARLGLPASGAVSDDLLILLTQGQGPTLRGPARAEAAP